MTDTKPCLICRDAGTCEVCDNPPMMAEELARLRPFAEELPELAARLREAGRPQSYRARGANIEPRHLLDDAQNHSGHR